MEKNNYDVLESQIGNEGGIQDNSVDLGKLTHADMVLGKKAQLSSEEKQDMDEFITRSRKASKKLSKMESVENQESISISDGWIPINREEMGIRSTFYPYNWQFYIRPATVQAVKNWTAVDEERDDALNKVFNDIIRNCVKIDTHSDTGASWAQIRSWDRFWFILKVREYTYATSTNNNIEFIDECSECNTDITYKLNSESLFYEFPDEDLVEKYWTGEYWKINPREYGVDHDEIILYTPTIGKDESIIEWGTSQMRTKGKFDETFIKFLVWLLPKPIKDINLLDRQVQKIYREYKSWDVDMFSFMNDVINNITINQSEKLRCICPICGQEATSLVQFPNGIKSLFQSTTAVKKFGSR